MSDNNQFPNLKGLLNKEEKKKESEKQALDIINGVKKSIEKVHEKSIDELNDKATADRMKEIKSYTPKVEMNIKIKPDSDGMAIPPEIESLLFGYYYAGVGLKTIHNKYGQKYNFSYSDLVSCSMVNKWPEQLNAIKGEIVNKRIDAFAQRSEEYCTFLDDVISEAMARFLDNVKSGGVNNPFETLKITSIKDLKEAMAMWLELQNKGVKKVEVSAKSLSDVQAAKMLELLNSDIVDADFTEEPSKE